MKRLLTLFLVLVVATFAYAQPIRRGGSADIADEPATGTLTAVGIIAETTVPTAVTDGDAVGLWGDEYGRVYILGSNPSVGAVDVNPVSQEPVGSGSILMESVTFDADPDDDNPQTSSAVFIGDKKKVGFLFQTIIDRTGATVQVDYTFEVSPDNTLWITADVIMSAAGTDGPVAVINQQSATDATIENVAYLADGFTAQYIRVISTCTDTDADDTAVVLVYLNYQK